MRRMVEVAARFWVRHHLTFPLALVFGVAAIGISVWVGAGLGDSASTLLPGALFLAAAMINVLLRVWSWEEANETILARLTRHELKERAERERLRQRFDALERLQTVSAVATTASVLLILVLILAALTPPVEVADEVIVPLVNLWATHIAAGLATAVAVFLLAIVADTVNTSAAALKASRTAVGAQSGPNG